MDKLIADSGEWTKNRKELCDKFWDDCAQESCDVPCSRVLEAETKTSEDNYIKCAECGSSVYVYLALKINTELFCSHKCIKDSQESRKRIRDASL
jgi:hypothetical protein